MGFCSRSARVEDRVEVRGRGRRGETGMSKGRGDGGGRRLC